MTHRYMTHREVWQMTTLRPARAVDAPEVWRDKKRHLWLMGLIAPTALFVMPPIIWGMNQLGWDAAAQAPPRIGPLLLSVLLPLLDLPFRADRPDPPGEGGGRLENDRAP